MLTILKASAGSGKTYSLAKEYIRLILESDKPDAYRHVLAVTFTNKATDEMKRRILKELHVLSTDTDSSPYIEDLEKESRMPREQIQKRAQRQLFGILHDYSSFAVSTIDRFFQQTLRSFSREIGQFASYQVQLDREALVIESVDRVLDGLSEDDAPLLEWLTRGVQDDLQQRGKFSLEGRLQEVAASLHKLPEGQARFSRGELDRLRESCRAIARDYEKRVGEAAARVLDVLQQEGVDPAESNRGFLKGLYKYAPPTSPIVRPTDSFMEKAPDPDKWFAKSKDRLRQQLRGILDAPLEDFLNCFGSEYRLYMTALILQGQLYGLGVAGELRQAFAAIQREKNILSLDDSNTILKGIIDGTDTPFIYEKLGVRFENFLLDEFQDTADIQWENLRPLLQGSDSTGQESLVVGDVKQSIYRWRGGDWSLLGSRLQQEFPQSSRVSTLRENHRTCHGIVEFNNAFFPYAAARLDDFLADDEGSISALYDDVAQDSRFPDPAPGQVEVSFVEDQMEEILNTVQDLERQGWAWEDIAVLVRGNAEGSDIAARLLSAGIPVVSDDSLFVKSSVTVRRLVSQLSLMDAPSREEDIPSVAGYLARSLEVHVPEHYHSLIDLAEGFLRDLRASDPQRFDAEVPYIQSFMDYLQDWVSGNGNNLGAFLRNWKEAQPKIASPETGHAVRVMTIHKSKGLEFPFVIVPFTEKVTLYKAGTSWRHPAVEGTPLEEVAGGMYRVTLDRKAESSLFEKDCIRERKLSAIDSINVFYVALTRAKYGLKIIGPVPPKKQEELSHFAQILHGFVGGEHYRSGVPYNVGGLRREAVGVQPLQASYESFPADSDRRLRFSPEAVDYFGEDGSFGVQASQRIRGNVLHGILSRTVVPDDLPAAVAHAVKAGELPASERDVTLSYLREKLRSVAARGWFAPEAQVRCEAAILGPDGGEYRPDRVVLHPDGTVDVVDYKFGRPEPSYPRQVGRYVQLYRKMGCHTVRGFLWYLEEDSIQEVWTE